MSRKDTSIVCTAGEHFVAFRLSQLGFVVALPRAGTPTIDLMVSSQSGKKNLNVQVKTASWAKREMGRGKNRKLHHLEFPLGHKAAFVNDPCIYYAFVDLNGRNPSPSPGEQSIPDVYIVPSIEVQNYCRDWAQGAKLVRWHVPIDDAASFKNNWAPIVQYLEAGSDS